ncbi:HAD-IIA family hydrolase [Actinocatenispora rupis]|uniref:Sugar-phosphatase n=1 Tax=Actinocatenispora rupis TaxID=519421 RepID=A0A8J3NCN5_9ACTN|nr:HAD-IIA family hydrolase [Actinocatenispora rupis]GID11977.1 sugar-phosphatase [Actinocatenispora rupis]
MTGGSLLGCDDPLVPAYDVVLLDLDGVVYLGDEAIPYAAESLAEVRSRGGAVHFVTNNAARRADTVAERLRGFGVAAEPDEVTTSAQGAGALLAERWPAGSLILVIGSDALAAEIADAGLVPTRTADDKPVAVVQGYGREVGWEQLAEATVAVRAGATWVATNLDSTLPSPRGPLPGNGSIVAAVAHATGRRPDAVVGKPEPALFEQAARRRHADRPLVVGDRLDTDIEGGNRAGMASLLVMTGVTTAAELLAAPPELRPSYLAADLRGLLVPHEIPSYEGGVVGCGGWSVRRANGEWRLAGNGDEVTALRALCVAYWSEAGRVVGADTAATDVLTGLGLS